DKTFNGEIVGVSNTCPSTPLVETSSELTPHESDSIVLSQSDSCKSEISTTSETETSFMLPVHESYAIAHFESEDIGGIINNFGTNKYAQHQRPDIKFCKDYVIIEICSRRSEPNKWIGSSTTALPNICRFCLSQGGVMSAIFADSGQEITSLPAKIMSCVSIQIYAGDGLPALICHRCLYQVERSYEFKEQCEHSDATLRQFVKKQRMGEVCQAMTVKLENAEEESNDEDQLENGMDHCESDCTSPQDDNMGAKQNDLLYKAPQLLDIEPSSLQGDKSSAGEWTYGQDMTSNNFLFENGDGFLQTGSFMLKNEDIQSIIMVVDPLSTNLDLDSESDDNYPEEVSNEEYMGVNSKKSRLKVFGHLNNNVKRVKKLPHRPKNGGEKPFSCPECGKTFAQRAHLARHELVHTGERPYGCSMCGKAFADSSTLTTHMRIHTGERPFVCDICGKAFAGRSDLRKHAIIHTGRRPYVCSVCSKSFTRSTNLKKHARIHSGVRPHACRECSKTFAAKGDLTRHALIHSGCKPFVCKICNVAFARRDKLTRHEKTHGRDQHIHTTKIKCEEKGEKSADNEHSQEEDHDIETFVVNVDPYEMEEKEQITVGEKHRHAQPTSVVQNNKESFEENILSESKVIKPFLCDVCFKSFSDRAYLRTHMQLHTGIRAHRCNLCSKAFVRRRELLRHEKVHSGERPYGCNICGKRFSRRDKLTRHEKIHAEHRRHKCELCPASFLRSDELTRHAMCHTGERPWCCSVCYKSFFSKAELNRHSKTHADVKPYKCDLCTMAFCRKDKLTRHQKTHANKQRLFKFSEISCRKSDSITNESEMNNSLTLKHLSSPDVDGNFRNNRKSVSDEEVTKEEDVEDPEVSLSRLGQNPEILLFPISQP
ncbi:hypothetical protein C0J52_17428, partial [Blattella germanica]